jgi:DNA polymerase-1
MERIFAIDGNFYLWRTASTYRSRQPIEQILPYNFLSLVTKDALAVQANYLLIAFDGTNIFRYKIDPGYKANRRETSVKVGEAEITKDTVYSCLPNIFNLLNSVGIPFYQAKKYEADDILASIAYKYHNPDKYLVILGTKDKDAYQYLKPGIRLYDSCLKDKTGKPKPRFITYSDVESMKGLLCEQMIDYQILIGDTIDNIPNIKGITPSKAKQILKQYKTIHNWYKSCKEARELLNPQKDRLILNRKLVTLSTECPPPHDLKEWKLSKQKIDNPHLSKSFHNYYDFIWPKSKGLF